MTAIARKHLALIALFLAIGSGPVSAETPGVTDTEIEFGQSAAFEGPAGQLGTEMRLGIRAAFEEANQAGGVHGRKLVLNSYNDGYEPEAAIENMHRLIDEDQVFAIIGSVGTPTSRASEPIASKAGVPFIGAFTGAEFLRKPYRPTVINIRASYFQETETLVGRLVEVFGMRRIAVLFQDDSYGRAGLEGVRRALARRKLEPVATGTYVRNTQAVKTALLAIRRGKPEAVIIIGAYQPAAVFIKWAHKLKLDALFLNISFVGSNALAAALGPESDGVIVSQVVPLPEDLSMPIVRDYRHALAALDPEAIPGFVSLEGYLVGRVVLVALDHVGRDLTRKRFLSEFTSPKTMRIGGLTLTYGPGDNQGLDRVFVTIMGSDGRFYPLPQPHKP